MRRRHFYVALIFGALGLTTVSAHEVHHTVEAGSAVIVQLKYADGKPFTFEAFEATPEGAEMPSQVGRTDNEGRAVFVTGTVKQWKFKAYTADGHGVSLKLDAPAVGTAVAPTTDTPERGIMLFFGLSLLLAGFGTYQLWVRKNNEK